MRSNFYKLGFYILLLILIYKSSIKKNYSTETEKEISCRLFNLTHLIIPFHIKQLKNVFENIIEWSKYEPCNHEDYFNKKMPKIIFYVGYLHENTVKNLNSQLERLLPNLRCFSNRDKIEVVKFKFNKNNNKHVLGARLMFEFMLAKKHRLFKNSSYIFYMEPDTRPVRSGWLNALQDEIYKSTFWVKGAIFRGFYELKINKYLPNKYHINGNAIYNIGDEKFSEFYFGMLRPFVERHNDSVTAYDTDFSEFLFDIDNYDYMRTILHNFVLTETIQNLWMQNYSVRKIRMSHPRTFLIHGGYPMQ